VFSELLSELDFAALSVTYKSGSARNFPRQSHLRLNFFFFVSNAGGMIADYSRLAVPLIAIIPADTNEIAECQKFILINA